MDVIKFVLSVVAVVLFVWLVLIHDYIAAAIKVRWGKREPSQPINQGRAQPRRTKTREISRNDRFGQVLSLISFAFTTASWGWAVISPESSASFGSILFFLAVVSFLVALLRLWRLPQWVSALIVAAVLCGYGVFDWNIIWKPQKGKEFKTMLVEGYNIASECSQMPAHTEMPEWMRDQSKRWQARVEQMIADKLDYKDLQLWYNTAVLGRVADVNLNAYQCLWAGTKVGTLETIIASHFDPALKHRDYNGPTYYFNAVNGEVDISDALNSGLGHMQMYLDGGNTPKVSVKGKMGDDKK